MVHKLGYSTIEYRCNVYNLIAKISARLNLHPDCPSRNNLYQGELQKRKSMKQSDNF